MRTLKRNHNSAGDMKLHSPLLCLLPCHLFPQYLEQGLRASPFLASAPIDETYIYPLLFPEVKGVFCPGLWYRANVVQQFLLAFSSTKWGERFFSPLWSFQRTTLALLRKHSSSHSKVQSSHLLWQRKLIMYLNLFSKISKQEELL